MTQNGKRPLYATGLFAFALLCVLTASPARATLLTAGSPLLFNIDFTGAPSHTGVLIQASWTPTLLPGQGFLIDLYNDPDGVDSVGGVGASAGTSFEGGYEYPPGNNDGIFSMIISVNSGSVDLTSLVVSAGEFPEDLSAFIPVVPPFTQTLIPASVVPEPATLALLGLGLAGLGFARRKQ